MKKIKTMKLKKIYIKLNQDFSFMNIMMRGKKSKSIFLPGCSLMKYGYNFLSKILNILKLYDNEIEMCSLCCTDPSEVLSDRYQKKIKQKLVDHIEKANKIYVACPNCYKALLKIKKDYNMNYEVIMIYDVLFNKISYIKNYNVLNNQVVIHDPCVIKDNTETQIAVRNILNEIGQKYVEPENTQNRTICCGNINMTHILKPQIANNMCKNRVSELNKKSDIILSYCGGCLYSFAKQKAKTIHLLELLFGRINSIKFINRISYTLRLNKC